MLHTQEMYGNSTCSSIATLRGPRQHVLAYSLPKLDHDSANIINLTMIDVKVSDFFSIFGGNQI